MIPLPVPPLPFALATPGLADSRGCITATEREISFLKGYTVFNAGQIDGMPSHFTAPAAPTLDPVQRIAHAESFFANTKSDIRHGGDRAYYATGAVV